MEALQQTFEYLISPVFFRGAEMTLVISVTSIVFGILGGLVLGLMQQSRFTVMQVGAFIYIWFFRGTPVLFQLVFVFNVLPSFGLLFSGFTSAILALSLNECAYQAEIMRSGLSAIGKGQHTAARALGLHKWQVMRYVILPQAFRIIIPPIGNQFMGMLKLSALVSVIAVEELLLVANQEASATFRYFEALSAAGIYYLFLTTVYMIFQQRIENWADWEKRRKRSLDPKSKSFVQRLLGMMPDERRI